MSDKLSEKARAIILKMQQNELTESVIYKKIAKFAKALLLTSDVPRSALSYMAQIHRCRYEASANEDF